MGQAQDTATGSRAIEPRILEVLRSPARRVDEGQRGGVPLEPGIDDESEGYIMIVSIMMHRTQDFSLIDRTSFAVMQRLGLTRVTTFDDDSAVYRYGRRHDRAFQILR